MNKASWWAVVPVGIVLLAVVAVAAGTMASKDQVAVLQRAWQWVYSLVVLAAGIFAAIGCAYVALEAAGERGDNFFIGVLLSLLLGGCWCLFLAIGTQMLTRLYFGMEPFTP
jgi:succinate dehydrogenase hydrophobic anchor subunit